MKSTRKIQPLLSSGLADVLFTPVQQRVLGLLFGQPERRFQSAEVIRLACSGTGAAHRLLTRLEATGLVKTERVGNQKHYQANSESPVFAELAGLIRKTAGGVEIYTEARVREFDREEADLKDFLAPKKRPGRRKEGPKSSLVKFLRKSPLAGAPLAIDRGARKRR